MAKRKEKEVVVYLTETQQEIVEKMEKEGTKYVLDDYANQVYDYGMKHGTDYGIVGSALATLAGFGVAKLYEYARKRINKK